ncbi:MAG: Ig-like domain-containing protein [Oscillospiraceae bacterium]|nr:Ig-like domain-containing protein [Oscillospiraceae bacterium]MDY4105434.1 Ig-like domain-containing protein [Oscillospiraceae bacterium]
MKQRRIYGTAAVLLAAAVCLTAAVIPVRAGDGAPVAENLEITTYRGVSCGGQLSAVDPEGDVLTYLVTTPPTKGTVEVEEDGSFVYTPKEGKRGKDYFGYVAEDPEGNRSQEATVIIRLVKAGTDVTYSDLEGSGAYYDALRLAENDIFVGQQIGGEYVFSPDAAVTRGEFLTMCMELTRQDILSGVSSTGFADDGDIPGWQKPYVATALMNGAITGYTAGGSATFAADEPITCSEAAVMLNSVLSVTDVASYDTDEGTPVWAGQAVANLNACRILPESYVPNASLTRAQAARMLSAALDVLAAR